MKSRRCSFQLVLVRWFKEGMELSEQKDNEIKLIKMRRLQINIKNICTDMIWYSYGFKEWAVFDYESRICRDVV